MQDVIQVPQVEAKRSRNVRNLCHRMLCRTTWAIRGLNWVISGQMWVKLGHVDCPDQVIWVKWVMWAVWVTWPVEMYFWTFGASELFLTSVGPLAFEMSI